MMEISYKGKLSQISGFLAYKLEDTSALLSHCFLTTVLLCDSLYFSKQPHAYTRREKRPAAKTAPPRLMKNYCHV